MRNFQIFNARLVKLLENTANLVASKYADQVKFVYYHFPLTQIHPLAFRASLAVECANDQNKFWEYHDLLFINQPKFSRTELVSYAEGLGLKYGIYLRTCLDERAKNDVVRADMDEGIKRDLKGTPTFYVNGKVVPDWSKLEQAVLDALPSQDQATSHNRVIYVQLVATI